MGISQFFLSLSFVEILLLVIAGFLGLIVYNTSAERHQIWLAWLVKTIVVCAVILAGLLVLNSMFQLSN